MICKWRIILYFEGKIWDANFDGLATIFKIFLSPFLLIAPRLSKLLLRLPALRLISAAVTEELFFAGLIGNVQIDSIIPYILKMESTDYNSQAVSGVWYTVPSVTATLDCEKSTANQSGGSADWLWSGHSVFITSHVNFFFTLTMLLPLAPQ